MARMPSNRSQHRFAQVPAADIPRSSFDRSHGHKTTLDAGFLYPIYVDEALPGDTFHVSMTGFARLATPIKPIMDNSYMCTFFFAVPYRLVWDNWVKLNGEQSNPGDSTDFLAPEIVAPAVSGFAPLSIYDVMGVPPGKPGLRILALPLRAYNLIWNEWFRDENLQQRAYQTRGDGPDSDASYALLRRGKRHDYFTSSLPWPQKGQSVSIPLGTQAAILTSQSPTRSGGGYSMTLANASNGAAALSGYHIGTSSGGAASMASTQTYTPGATGVFPLNLYADLSTATAATINQLRQAFQMQRLYERDARGGTRYTEVIRAHFGVVSPDARLQRPEYLGGGQTPVTVSPVAQTAPTGVTGSTTPQGNLSGIGTAVLHGHGFSKSFTEHCVILGLLSVRADLNYQQGLHRMWSRRSRFDWYWPALSHIGEQAVLSQEIYADGTANDQTVWGYQERYAEYRYAPSLVTGQFRSSYAQPLDVWHLAQNFATRPLLNSTFIVENPPFDRVVAVPGEPKFIFDSFFKVRCARPMPVYGVPGLIDHF